MAGMIKVGDYVKVKKHLKKLDHTLEMQGIRTPGVVPQMESLEGLTVKVTKIIKNTNLSDLFSKGRIEPDYHYCVEESETYLYIEEYFKEVTDENNNLLLNFD